MPLRGPRRPRRAPERRQLTRLKSALAAVGAACTLFLLTWPLGVAWWLDFSDEPAPSDYLVVLAGDFARPHAAAELYKAGLAPQVWLCRPIRPWGQTEAQRLGVKFPNEEELDRDILVKRGVPESAIHFYGDGVSSTFLEAEAFKAAARPEGKKVLVLTSRYHARRAKMIFRKVLAGSEVRMFGAADPEFDRRWWRSRSMMYAAVLETAKAAYWFAGGNLRRVAP